MAVGIKENKRQRTAQTGWRGVAPPSAFPPVLVVSLRVFFVSRPPHVPALMAVKDVGNVGLLDLRTRQVHPNAALVALDHRPPRERLPAVTGDQVPRIVACVDEEDKDKL